MLRPRGITSQGGTVHYKSPVFFKVCAVDAFHHAVQNAEMQKKKKKKVFCDVIASVLYRKMYEDTKMRVLPARLRDRSIWNSNWRSARQYTFLLPVRDCPLTMHSVKPLKKEEFLILEKSRSRRVGPKMWSTQELLLWVEKLVGKSGPQNECKQDKIHGLQQ